MVYTTMCQTKQAKGVIAQHMQRCWYQSANHSLCVTAMMRMYNQGVAEKLIAEKSRHRNLLSTIIEHRSDKHTVLSFDVLYCMINTEQAAPLIHPRKVH